MEHPRLRPSSQSSRSTGRTGRRDVWLRHRWPANTHPRSGQPLLHWTAQAPCIWVGRGTGSSQRKGHGPQGQGGLSIQGLSCVRYPCLLVIESGHSGSQEMAKPQAKGTLGPSVTQQEL